MTRGNLRARLRAVPWAAVAWTTAGTMAITAGLLAYGTLALPWPVRLLLGAFGVVVLALSFPAAWRWVLDGGDEDT